jgi:5'-deoxynucleotidase YfbR-like HD superfamily hydrolase
MSKSEFYAYPADKAGIEAVMRLQAVKRWHMIDTTRQQTLAEHSANVALLAYYVAVSSPQMFFGPAIYVMGAGLLHDLPEVFTGDIPSPTKKHLQGLDELESSVIPKEYAIDYQHSSAVKCLVKVCDLADGIRFIRNHGVDATATHAQEGLEKQWAALVELTRMAWPAEVHSHVFGTCSFYVYEYS